MDAFTILIYIVQASPKVIPYATLLLSAYLAQQLIKTKKSVSAISTNHLHDVVIAIKDVIVAVKDVESAVTRLDTKQDDSFREIRDILRNHKA